MRIRIREWKFTMLVVTLMILADTSIAATIVGSGTFENPGDLTIVSTRGGDILEFLDLLPTLGMTVDEALDQYGPADFRWATGEEVGELFEAFAITYVSGEETFVDLGLAPTSIEATTFLAFTHTSSNSAVGWIDDYTRSNYYTYSCISIETGCFPVASFTNNTQLFWPSEPTIAVYLVRGAIPEPTTVALLTGGMLGLAVLGRRRGPTPN